MSAAFAVKLPGVNLAIEDTRVNERADYIPASLPADDADACEVLTIPAELGGLRRHVSDVDDRAVVGDEGDRQRQDGVAHPEAVRERRREGEQHACVGRHLLAKHQPGCAFVGALGDFGRDHMDARIEADRRQRRLGLGLRRTRCGKQGRGESGVEREGARGGELHGAGKKVDRLE